MGIEQYNVEEIGRKLMEADMLLNQGHTISQVCEQIGVPDQTYYRWRHAFDGMKTEQARQLKELTVENARLKRAVMDLSFDKMLLEEIAEENGRAVPGVGGSGK